MDVGRHICRAEDPLGSYRDENLRSVRQLAKGYAPTGFLQECVPGGFKLSRDQDFGRNREKLTDAFVGLIETFTTR